MEQFPAQTNATTEQNKQPETKVWSKPLTGDEKKAAEKAKPEGSCNTDKDQPQGSCHTKS
jgi:hypothetical protein